MRVRLLWFTVFVSFLLACANRKQTPAQEEVNEPMAYPMAESIENDLPETVDPWLSYERTPCFGRCPVFTFEVFQNNRCTFDGRNFVDYIGTYEGRINDAQRARILRAAQSIHFFELDSLFDDPLVMDLHATLLSIEGKTVVNRFGGPDLRPLYSAIDEVIDAIEWTPFDRKN